MSVHTRLLLLITCLFFSLTLHAQHHRDSKRFQAIESEKIAFITKELNLTPKEAQRFFPVYNQYNTKLWDLRHAKSDASKREPAARPPAGVQSFSATPKAKSASIKKDILSYDVEKIELKKLYREKFSEVIGQARASQFFEVEQRFRENLIRELRSRQER